MLFPLPRRAAKAFADLIAINDTLLVAAGPDHAEALPPGMQAQEIVRTCRTGDASPCGAFATHVAIVGVRDELGNPTLSVVSLCSRHSQQGSGT